MLNLKYANDVIYEYITEATSVQPVKDRLQYKRILMESIMEDAGFTDTNRKAKLVENLYKDIIEVQNKVDFGTIPNTVGNITKLQKYDNILKIFEILNKKYPTTKPEVLLLAGRLHSALITSRGDFEFGFKFDVETIKLTYNTLVVLLYELLNLCIVQYINDELGKDSKKEFRSKNMTAIKSTRAFLISYDKGDWKRFVNTYKKDSKAFVGIVVALIPLALVMIFFAIREAIYLFYAASANVADYTASQAKFIKAHMDSSDEANSFDKQKRMHEKLESLSDFIYIHILKSEKKAAELIKQSNVSKISKKELESEVTSGSEDINLF